MRNARHGTVQTVFEFGPFSLDSASGQLLRRGKPVRVQRKVCELLQYLIEHRDRLVSKQELLDQVWRGIAVSPSSLSRTAAQLRKALQDDARHPRWICTIHGRGYRFVAEASEITGVALGSRSDGPVQQTEALLASNSSARVLAEVLEQRLAQVARAVKVATRHYRRVLDLPHPVPRRDRARG
jgi:DNA-binding winged helix-turn-helix (wHTH) protein